MGPLDGGEPRGLAALDDNQILALAKTVALGLDDRQLLALAKAVVYELEWRGMSDTVTEGGVTETSSLVKRLQKKT